MTARPTIQAIVFDLDDTLYPEVQFVQSGYRAVAERFADRLGPPEATLADLLAIFDSPDRSRAFNALLEHRSLPDDAELIKAMVATYRTHAPALTLHADAAAVLDRLTGRYPLGLITDGPLATQRAKFDALPLGSRFAAVVFTDELGPGRAKPHPAAFERVAEQLQVPHERCVYVGDNLAKDFLSPNQLGWRTVRIVRPDGIHRHRTAPPAGEPQHSLTTLDDLEATLGL